MYNKLMRVEKSPVVETLGGEPYQEDMISLPDVRNQMTPIVFLISAIESDEFDVTPEMIAKAKSSINNICQSGVFDGEN